jgi:sugar lactone lactonase YvrE
VLSLALAAGVAVVTIAVVSAAQDDPGPRDAQASGSAGNAELRWPRYGTLAGGLCSPGRALAFAVNPLAVTADGRGGFYVSDDIHAVVCHVDADGAVALVAGNGVSGYTGDGMAASRAELYFPSGLALAPNGDLVIADRWNQRVRRVDAVTGTITTIAGDGTAGSRGDGGPAVDAQLSFPSGVAVDRDGTVFIADSKNNRVRRVDPTGTITTIGRPDAALDLPLGVAVTPDRAVLVADANNNRVRRISADGAVSTVAGTGATGEAGDGGPAIDAQLSSPFGVAVTPDGFAIADAGNRRVRVVDEAGVIASLAIDPAVVFPTGIASDGEHGLLVADQGAHVVRRVVDGRTETVGGNGLASYSGDGGSGPDATFYEPIAVATTPDGGVLVADSLNHVIRRIDADLTTHLVAGTPGQAGHTGDGGPAVQATLEFPTGVAIDPAGAVLIADVGNHVVRRVERDGIITTIAGDGTAGSKGDDGPAIDAELEAPIAIASDAAGNVFIADAGNHRIRRVDALAHTIVTVAGTGTPGDSGDGGDARAAQLDSPSGIAVSAQSVVIADTGNQRVRAVDLGTGIITTLAGTGEIGFSIDGTNAAQARLDHPAGVAIDASGAVYIADKGNCLIRRVVRRGDQQVLTTVIGWTPVRSISPVCEFGESGAPPRYGTALTSPTGVAVTRDGSLVVADSLSHRVRVFPPQA